MPQHPVLRFAIVHAAFIGVLLAIEGVVYAAMGGFPPDPSGSGVVYEDLDDWMWQNVRLAFAMVAVTGVAALVYAFMANRHRGVRPPVWAYLSWIPAFGPMFFTAQASWILANPPGASRSESPGRSSAFGA